LAFAPGFRLSGSGHLPTGYGLPEAGVADSPSAARPENLLYFGKCTGYIRGVADGYYLAGFAAGNLPAERRLCTPTAVTSGHLMQIVKKYLEDDPKRLDVYASFSTV
jgi:hypothetical protein